jgi:hypothetical protein
VELEARRQALREHSRHDMEHADHQDLRDAESETPQEMHERMLQEDAGEGTLDLLEALRELQGGELVTWKVWRVAGPEGEPLPAGPSSYCGEFGNSQLTLENMARRCGAGKFKCKGRYANGRIAGARTVTIDQAAAKEFENTMQTNSGGSFNMGEFLALQQQQEERREQRERERAERDRADRKDFLTLVLPIAGQLASALLTRAAPAAPPPTDLPALITALRPTVAPPDPSAQMKTTLETMMLMKKVMGDGGSDDNLTSIISAVAPHAGPVLAALASRQPTAAPQPPPKPAPGSQPTRVPMTVEVRPDSPVTAAAQPPQPPQQSGIQTHTGVNLDAPSDPSQLGQRDMFAQIKPQVDQMVIMASQGADPVQAADVFFDHVMSAMDDATYDGVCNFLFDENCVAKLTIFNTGVTQYRDFFEAFRTRATERVTAESEAAQS